MKTSAMPRRAFLQTAALAATALAAGACHAFAGGSSRPIGCFNRPWMQKFGPKAPLDTPQPAGTIVVASGTSCRHQLEHLSECHPRHIAEVLAAGLKNGK